MTNYILSLDCSTTHVGWAIFEEDTLIDYGRLEPTIKDLEWRERVSNFIPQLEELIIKYKPIKIYQEQVPQGGQGGNLVLSQLFYVQGAFRVIEEHYVNEIEYIEVGTWRKSLGINNGDQHRDAKKIKSIQKANELFNINLPLEFTSSGKYNDRKSNDDTADAINIYASTREKYKVKTKTFGKGGK